MVLPILVIIGFVAGVTIMFTSVAMAVKDFIERAKGRLASRPRGPPGPPDGMTVEQLIEDARSVNLDLDYYHFAFIGGSSSGKSTLINALRELDDVEYEGEEENPHDMYGAAPVGSYQTTTKPREYGHPPDQPYWYRLWDMPGSGVDEYPSATYFDDLKLHTFDVLLLVAEKELGECEIPVLQKAQEKKVPIVVVITQADTKLEHKKRIRFRTREPSFEEYTKLVQDVITEGKNRVLQRLEKHGISEPQIFVVSAWMYRDFCKAAKAPITPTETDGTEQRQIAPADQEHLDKLALLSFETAALLNYLSNAAIERRLIISLVGVNDATTEEQIAD